MSEAGNLEMLLREALIPVEPPADLVERVEDTLLSITALAADELEAWELSAMRDPRNWVRPAAALLAGGAAAGGLVVLRARHRARGETVQSVRWPPIGRSAERAVRDLEREARRLLSGR
jgi:hypothetical protein